MANLGSLWYTMGIKDLTDADLQKINAKLKNLGAQIQLTPKILKEITQSAVPKGIKIELDPSIKSEALARAVEGKTMKVAVSPLLTGFREAIVRATRENPPQAEIGVQETKLRKHIEDVLYRQGFMLRVRSVDSDFTKSIEQNLRGRTYRVRIHADANEIARSVQASLMQVQSRYFGLQVSKDILRRSIDEALMGKPFHINIAVHQDQARKAVQDALLRAQVMGKDQALAYQRLQAGEYNAARAEIARLKAEQMGAANAAKVHATASVNLGGAMGRNITVAGELGAAMASLYSIHAAKQFLSQVIEIGGELEHQKIALETIYGSGSKMETLFGQIKGLARESPFGVMELTKNVKQLSAYGVAYNEVYDTAKRLADISAATSVDIQRLILAFGKTKNRTFLDGLEAKQFAYANIPIYDALSKKLTELEGKFVSVKDVMKRISKKEIGFDMVKDILWEMTDEGGKFYNMQEKLAGSVKTSWKLVRDNIELMFGEIAESGIGEGLKDVAVILQGLTREWKTLAAVVGGGAAAFGIYKVAVMGTNALLDKQTGSLVANHLAEKQAQAAKMRTLGLTSNLSAKEKELIATRKRLTASDLEYLYVEKGLTEIEIKRLYLSGKITRAELQQAVALGVLTQKEFEQIAGTNALNGAWLRFNATLKGTWANIKSGVAMAFGMIFNWTNAAMAAIGGAIALWQRNSEEMEKAKEIGDTIFSKAADGADSLKKSLEDMKPAEELSDLELNQGIENMIQTIKDYSPTPLKDINDALVAQDGHLLTIQERYEALRIKVEGLNAAYSTAEKGNFGGMIENAIKDTDGGNWFTKLFDDDLNTNLKDYSNALKRAEDRIREFSTEHTQDMRLAVDAALEADAGFREATRGMQTYEEKFKELLEFGDDGKFKYLSATLAARKKTGANLYDLANKGQIQEAYNEVESDYNKFVSSVMTSLRQQGITDVSQMTDEMKGALAISFKSWLDGMEGVLPEVKTLLSGMIEETFPVSIIEDDLTPQWVKGFQKLANASTDAEVQQAVRNLQLKGYNDLSDAEKKIIDDLIRQAGEDIASQQPEMKNRVQSWLNSNPLMWQVKLQIQEAEQGGIEPLARELINARGGSPFVLNASITQTINNWAKSGTASGMWKAAQEEWKAAQEELKAAEKLGKSTQAYQDAKEKLDEIKAALSYAKREDLMKEKGDSGAGRQHRDMVASRYKAEFADLRDGWAAVKGYAKSLGMEKAYARVENSNLFRNYDWGKGPKSETAYWNELNKMLLRLRDEGIQGHPERETLANDIEKMLFNVEQTEIERNIKDALDMVSKEAERQIADWNLYDKIRKATGNKELAMSIAFGMNASAETDYPKMIEAQLDKEAKAYEDALVRKTRGKRNAYTPEGYTYRSLKGLYDKAQAPGATDAEMKAWTDVPEDLRKAWEKANGDILKYFDKQREEVADMVSQFRNTQEEIVAITAEAEEKKRKIRETKDLSPVQKQQIIDRIDADLNYQVFQKNGEYLKFFNAILSMTKREAEDVGKKIKEALDEKLKAGSISAKEYCDEMEKIDKQLEKIRNKQKGFGGFGSFAKGGLRQMFQDKFDQAQSDYNKAVQDFDTAKQQFDMAVVKGDEAGMQQAESAMNAADSMKVGVQAAMKGAQGAMQTMAVIDTIVHSINDTVQGIRDAFYSIQDMADSFGVDTSADTGWGAAGAFFDAFSQASEGATKAWDSLKSGNIGGVISGVVQSVTSWFTVFNRWHDAKLEKTIERSKEAVQIMQNQYDILEKRMANFLGNAAGMDTGVAGGAYGKQFELMKGQLAELEKQRQAEIDKKKTDESVVEDYNKQIEEMKISIRDFAIEAAKSVYGIDLNGWAEQLGDALVDAFAAGEDAAEAFDKKVGDIMRDVASKMISQDILAPMFGDLRDYLFGKDGKPGVYNDDWVLDANDMSGMKDYLDMIREKGIPAAQSLFDAINEATGGMLDDTDKAKSGMTAGLQSLTEDTGDLLASYVNGIRGDTSVIRLNWDKLMESTLPQMNVVAQAQLQEQRQIAENTLRNAIAAEAILKSNQQIYGLFARVTQGGAKVYVQ